jgi:hypothetical protein
MYSWYDLGTPLDNLDCLLCHYDYSVQLDYKFQIDGSILMLMLCQYILERKEQNFMYCKIQNQVTYVLRQKKVKLSLCLNNYALCHDDVLGSGGIASPFLISVPDEGEWSASWPSCFIHGTRPLQYPFDRRLGGPENWPRCS